MTKPSTCPENRDRYTGSLSRSMGSGLDGGSLAVQITARSYISSIRTARSAHLAVVLDPAGPCRESGKTALVVRAISGPTCRSTVPGWEQSLVLGAWQLPELQSLDVVPVDFPVRDAIGIIRTDRAVDQNR